MSDVLRKPLALQVVHNAAVLMQSGAHRVKLEGGGCTVPAVCALDDAVHGH